MVQMEITAQEIFKYSSLSRIQPVQPKIQKSVVNRRNCEVHVIRKLPPIFQWDSNYGYDQWFRWKEPRKSFPDLLIYLCVLGVLIRPMVQTERTAWELSRSSNIHLCGQRTDTTYGSDGKSSAREIFRSSNISLCDQRTDTTDGSDGKSNARSF